MEVAPLSLSPAALEGLRRSGRSVEKEIHRVTGILGVHVHQITELVEISPSKYL